MSWIRIELFPSRDRHSSALKSNRDHFTVTEVEIRLRTNIASPYITVLMLLMIGPNYTQVKVALFCA